MRPRSDLSGRGWILTGAAASVPPVAKPHNRSAAFVPFRGARRMHPTTSIQQNVKRLRGDGFRWHRSQNLLIAAIARRRAVALRHSTWPIGSLRWRCGLPAYAHLPRSGGCTGISPQPVCAPRPNAPTKERNRKARREPGLMTEFALAIYVAHPRFAVKRSFALRLHLPGDQEHPANGQAHPVSATHHRSAMGASRE